MRRVTAFKALVAPKPEMFASPSLWGSEQVTRKTWHYGSIIIVEGTRWKSEDVWTGSLRIRVSIGVPFETQFADYWAARLGTLITGTLRMDYDDGRSVQLVIP